MCGGGGNPYKWITNAAYEHVQDALQIQGCSDLSWSQLITPNVAIDKLNVYVFVLFACITLLISDKDVS